jgi:hypothetical protein
MLYCRGPGPVLRIRPTGRSDHSGSRFSSSLPVALAMHRSSQCPLGLRGPIADILLAVGEAVLMMELPKRYSTPSEGGRFAPVAHGVLSALTEARCGWAGRYRTRARGWNCMEWWARGRSKDRATERGRSTDLLGSCGAAWCPAVSSGIADAAQTVTVALWESFPCGVSRVVSSCRTSASTRKQVSRTVQ